MKNTTVILYFLAGAVPTPEELDKITLIERKFGVTVRHRNGRFADTSAIEKCDYVAGSVSLNYRKAVPYIDETGEQHEPIGAVVSIGTGEPQNDTEATKLSPLAAEVGTVNGGWGAA